MLKEAHIKLTADRDPEKDVAVVELNERMSALARGKKDMEKNPEYVKTMLGLVTKMNETVTKENATTIITSKTPEGKEIKIDLKERQAHWTQFYKKYGIYWAEMPDEIRLKPEQIEKIKERMAEGFTNMIIVPANLVDKPVIDRREPNKSKAVQNWKYRKLRELLRGKRVAIEGNQSYYDSGNDQGTLDYINGARIILTRDSLTLREDVLSLTTIGQNIFTNNDVERLFPDKGYSGHSESTWLIAMQDYFDRFGSYVSLMWEGPNDVYESLPGSIKALDGKHIFIDGDGSNQPSDSARRYARYHCLCFDDLDGLVRFKRIPPIGCRLIASFDINS